MLPFIYRLPRRHMKTPTYSASAAVLFVLLDAGIAAKLPPNTALNLVAEISSTTQANDTFWNASCGLIPESALFVRLVMGTVNEAPFQLAGYAPFVLPLLVDLACYESIPKHATCHFALDH